MNFKIGDTVYFEAKKNVFPMIKCIGIGEIENIAKSQVNYPYGIRVLKRIDIIDAHGLVDSGSRLYHFCGSELIKISYYDEEIIDLLYG